MAGDSELAARTATAVYGVKRSRRGGSAEQDRAARRDSLGLDHPRVLHRHNGGVERSTIFGGSVIKELFA
jgi:hypothetical protein